MEGTLRTPIKSELHERVSALLHRGERRIVLDLARVSDIDAAGVGELVRLSNMAAGVRGVLLISRPTTHVRRLLDATGLSRLLIDD
jgi:anti-anti-sigma factor